MPKKNKEIFFKGINLKKKINAGPIKEKTRRFKVKKLMEKSLIYPGAFNKSFIGKLTADPHAKTRKILFYLLQVTVLVQSNPTKKLEFKCHQIER